MVSTESQSIQREVCPDNQTVLEYARRLRERAASELGNPNLTVARMTRILDGLEIISDVEEATNNK